MTWITEDAQKWAGRFDGVGQIVPAHALLRLAAALAREEATYWDDDLKFEGRGSSALASGQILVVTPTRIAVVMLDKAAEIQTNVRTGATEAETGAVQVVVCSRFLAQVTIGTGSSNYAWHHEEELWPSGERMTFLWRGMNPLHLPLNDEPKQRTHFLEQLQDLLTIGLGDSECPR